MTAASFAHDWAPTILGGVVAFLGVVGGLLTTVLTLRGQRGHDLELRKIEFRQEQASRLSDSIIETASALAGSLTSASAGLAWLRSDDVAGDLEKVQLLLRECQDHVGRLGLLIGRETVAWIAAGSALKSLNGAFGWAREEQRRNDAGDTAGAKAARAELNKLEGEADHEIARFFSALRPETTRGLAARLSGATDGEP